LALEEEPHLASSRPYRLTVRETLQKVLVAEDSVQTKLDLPPILPPGQTSEILAKVLKERGFTEQGASLVRESGGVKTEIQPGTGEVKVSAQGSEEVDLSDEGDLPACSPCAERAKETLRVGLREKLTREADSRKRGLQTQVTDRLEGALGELGCELERVANQVTSSALKRKAALLGQIKQITQDPESGAMTIVVEVAFLGA
jgi:FtsH ternary system domain X5